MVMLAVWAVALLCALVPQSLGLTIDGRVELRVPHVRNRLPFPSLTILFYRIFPSLVFCYDTTHRHAVPKCVFFSTEEHELHF